MRRTRCTFDLALIFSLHNNVDPDIHKSNASAQKKSKNKKSKNKKAKQNKKKEKEKEKLTQKKKNK